MKKLNLFSFLIFVIILIFIMVLYGFTGPLPLMTCILVLFGSTWAQLTEGLDILKRFEIVSFGLVIIGIILFIGLLLEEFYFSKNEPATLTAIWEMLTTSSNNEKQIINYRLYESILCLVSSFVWGFLASILKNNKEDVFILIIVFFLVHLWGAERSEIPVYPGSFFSYIWEPTTNTIHHPTVSVELEPKLTELGENIWSILKFVAIGVVSILFLSFFVKNTNKEDAEHFFILLKWIIGPVLFGTLIGYLATLAEGKWENFFEDITNLAGGIFAGFFFFTIIPCYLLIIWNNIKHKIK